MYNNNVTPSLMFFVTLNFSEQLLCRVPSYGEKLRQHIFESVQKLRKRIRIPSQHLLVQSQQ